MRAAEAEAKAPHFILRARTVALLTRSPTPVLSWRGPPPSLSRIVPTFLEDPAAPNGWAEQSTVFHSVTISHGPACRDGLAMSTALWLWHEEGSPVELVRSAIDQLQAHPSVACCQVRRR